MKRRPHALRTAVVPLILLLAGSAAGAVYFGFDHQRTVEREAAALTGGDPERGRQRIRQYGCITCHDVPGFSGTSAHVGPPLSKFAFRMYIGGVAENTPENLTQFLRDPRGYVPRGAMPNLGVTEEDARDLAAFLYTLQ